MTLPSPVECRASQYESVGTAGYAKLTILHDARVETTNNVGMSKSLVRLHFFQRSPDRVGTERTAYLLERKVA